MTHSFKRLSHSLYECKYHIVFCPKYRYRIFKDELADYTRQQIESLCRQKDQIEVLELNVQPDHIHLVLSIPPQIRGIEWDGLSERQTGPTSVPTL